MVIEASSMDVESTRVVYEASGSVYDARKEKEIRRSHLDRA